MTDQPSLKQFLDELSSYSDTDDAASASPGQASVPPIGRVLEIAGSGSKIWMDFERLQMLAGHADPSVAMGGLDPVVGADLGVRAGCDAAS